MCEAAAEVAEAALGGCSPQSGSFVVLLRSGEDRTAWLTWVYRRGSRPSSNCSSIIRRFPECRLIVERRREVDPAQTHNRSNTKIPQRG